MRLGILGGSFNPVHQGHLSIAYNALTTFKLDRVVFVPAYRSPFKLNHLEKEFRLTPTKKMEKDAKARINLLAAAIEGDPRFTIDSCEIRRGGVSYTVDTLADIISRYLPTGKPVLIIGDDLAADFTKWREYERILHLADIVIGRRVNASQIKYPFPHIHIENDVVDISSSEIRDRAHKSGDGANHYKLKNTLELFPLPSYDYKRIKRYDVVHIETEVRKILSTERFLHSRHTALQAYDLCRRFRLNPTAGYLAGIAHDLAKQLNNKELTKIVKEEGSGYSITPLEKQRPNLLHGKAAAVLLRDRLCIHNEDVLEAVAYHTSGYEGMGQLAKVVYIADKTESTRNIERALRIKCREDSLDDILCAVLEKTVIKLKMKGMDLSEDTLKILEKIKEKKN